MIGRTGGRIALMMVVLTTIGCDRVTKHAATTMLAGMPDRSYLADTVRLGYVENAGGFLSLGASLPPVARTAFFTIATGFMLFTLVVLVIRRKWDRLPTLGLTLFVAGGASNWIDRIARGSVVDFLNVGVGPARTGVFNVADVAIMLGAGIFVLTEFRKGGNVPPSTGTADSTV
jgi:signal peptidase II